MLVVGPIHADHLVAQLLDGGSIVVALKREQQTTAMPGGRGNGEFDPGVRQESRADGKTLIGFVGTHLDGRGPANSVGSSDAPDYNEHGSD